MMKHIILQTLFLGVLSVCAADYPLNNRELDNARVFGIYIGMPMEQALNQPVLKNGEPDPKHLESLKVTQNSRKREADNQSDYDRLVRLQEHKFEGAVVFSYKADEKALTLLRLPVKKIVIQWVLDVKNEQIVVAGILVAVRYPADAYLSPGWSAVIETLERQFGQYGDNGYYFPGANRNNPNKNRLFIGAERFTWGGPELWINLQSDYRFISEEEIRYRNVQIVEQVKRSLTPYIAGRID